jgi:transposase
MALLSVIRRWHFRERMPIREIERRTGLSRNTIRKYLRAGTVEPKFKVPDRPSKLDPFAEKLSGWLRIEAGKSRKQRHTAKQMHTDLVALGYDGSYGRVAAFVRAWKADRQRDAQTSGRGTFVPLVLRPGEAFQFDWSEDWAAIGGERTKLQVAHTKLSHSRAFIVRAYRLQTHEMLFDALTQAFRVLDGVPRRGIFDNMKTAVDRIVSGKARQVNARFAAMASPPCHQSPGLMAKRSGICSSLSSATRLPVGRRGRSRRTFRMRADGSGSHCPASPIWRL